MANVIFREDRCKGCGLCIEACPKKIVSFSDRLNLKGYHPVELKEEVKAECVACAACGKICPDLVITIEK